jgi:putative DNA primase/helicase
MAVQYDGPVWLSTGENRNETSWKNKHMEWSDLVARLQKPCHTDETAKDYHSFNKDRQDAIKDVGGFVGGPVTGGRRIKGNVGSRSLLTLDVDRAPVGFWDVFQLYYGNAAFVYSTHGSLPDRPRLRLVMPFARDVHTDEYQAISRWIAGQLGIDHFCDVSYRPTQIMYWPSTPKDQKYYWAFQDGPWIDPDQVLGYYHNWKDSSQWPLSSRAKAIPSGEMKKAGDPHEKPGIIGAFCRTYTIQEAIEEFLPDVYDETDDDNRFTYLQGSTSKGLVVYEDKYAYSHHGTDPVSGRCCNAFDLVRIHLFGGEDDKQEAGTPVNRLPSYGRMNEFALKDKTVVRELAETKFASAEDAFKDVKLDVGKTEDSNEWKGELKMDGRGNLLATSKNIRLILENDPILRDCFAYDRFLDETICLRDLPWRAIEKSGEPFKDEDEACLRNHLEDCYQLAASNKISDAFTQYLVEHSFHPVRDYLKSLTWDKTNRIATLLIDYFGARDTEYVRTVTRITFVAAIARVMRPGIKFDTVLTLISEEGKNKSTFIEKLGMQWYSSDFGPLTDMKTCMEQLQGNWLIEIGEMDAFKRAEMTTVKHFVSKGTDKFRKAYAKRSKSYPRQCIFIGTSNELEFLTEIGKHRRFLPVALALYPPIKDVFKDLTAGEIRQIWAEAVQLHSDKTPLHLSKSMEEEAFKVVQQHTMQDERDGLITEYLDKLVPEDWDNREIAERKSLLHSGLEAKEKGVLQDKVCALQIWVEVFNKPQADANRWATKFISDFLSRQKRWERKIVRCGPYGVQKGFVRVDLLSDTFLKDLL